MQYLSSGVTLQSGKYRIERVLGQGGFGITYLAIQSGLERKVAIKEFFMKELCNREESTNYVTLGTAGNHESVSRFREKFLKEARNIARLNHPNIVRIIDVFEENGTAYYVMEYAENGSLAEKVKRKGYLSESVATRYILQVAEALDYIHQQKMNHLDVKPANIMLNEKDEPVLIDFGLSKQYDAATGNQTSTTPVGISEGYAPMEQYKQGGVGTFSPETDIYALGATFFKLLTGMTPPSASDVYEDGVPVEELKAKGVSQKIIDVICKAMMGKKKDRLRSAKEFVGAMKHEGIPSSGKKDEVSIAPEKTVAILSTETKANFDYPLHILVNKTIYTDCQIWKIKSIDLKPAKTVVSMSVQSYGFPTTACSGSGKIKTDDGKVYQQTDSSLPKSFDDSLVIEAWQKLEVEDIYPPIPSDTTGFTLLNETVSLKGIVLRNGTYTVAEADKEDYVNITREEVETKLSKKNGSDTVSSILYYIIIAIILIMIFIFL